MLLNALANIVVSWHNGGSEILIRFNYYYIVVILQQIKESPLKRVNVRQGWPPIASIMRFHLASKGG